ncbi:hypothetical protein EMELA_v1c08450 [Mesoplasma melaleucae]|uniref:Uncharacterized protein n=1 Tax=Mesoplasma melaleucae TaxID=81459 RepID=A0A2K8NWY6_9MOLU|nr:hypothetical protein EMELA_v1c08450 [Mesoplasma melaleucae]
MIILLISLLSILNKFLDNYSWKNFISYINKNLNKDIVEIFLSKGFFKISIILITIITPMIILKIINLINMKNDFKKYKIHILKNEIQNLKTINKIYKKCIIKPNIISWLLIPFYIINGIFIGTIYAINDIYNNFRKRFAWNVNMIAFCLATVSIVLLLLYVTNLFLLKFSRNNIDKYYGYKIKNTIIHSDHALVYELNEFPAFCKKMRYHNLWEPIIYVLIIV